MWGCPKDQLAWWVGRGTWSPGFYWQHHHCSRVGKRESSPEAPLWVWTLVHSRHTVLGISPRDEVTDASAPVVCSAWSTILSVSLAPLLPPQPLVQTTLPQRWTPRFTAPGRCCPLSRAPNAASPAGLLPRPPHQLHSVCASKQCAQHTPGTSCRTNRWGLPHSPTSQMGSSSWGSFAQLNYSSHTKRPHFSIPRVGGTSGCMTDAQLCSALSGLSQARDLPQAQCPWSQSKASSLHLLTRWGVRTMYPPPAAEPQADWAAPPLPSVGMWLDTKLPSTVVETFRRGQTVASEVN